MVPIWPVVINEARQRLTCVGGDDVVLVSSTIVADGPEVSGGH